MSKIFLINEVVAFYPEKNLLVNNGPGGKKQILGRPGSRCLEILLEEPGTIVSHQRLYDNAWQNSMVETSPNTLYQTILLVRKALKAVSESSEDFIITVPRKGFVFNENMRVAVEEVESQPESEHFSTESTTLAIARNDKWPQRFLLHLRIKPAFMLVVIMTIAILSLLMAGYKYFLLKQDDFAREYTYYQQVDSCILYLRQPVSLYKNEIELFLKKHQEVTSDCVLHPLRYISIVAKPVSFFVIGCNRSTGASRNCTSSYIRSER
ncbi:winged helix-turn-helix domain-containing protein [Klebsiella sp. KE9038]|uniref:winged helix-turn-helix domain-containing protein n=1 Tax=Klebsiella sp. KE9038 TaxID=3118149 RepID=UPI003753CC5F